MKHLLKILFVLSLPAFWGCAATPQSNVNFTPDYWEAPSRKIGVYVSSIPEVKGHLSGAGCLLCLATASAINASLAKHMELQSNEDLNDLRNLLVDAIESNGAEVVLIEQPIDFKKLPKNSSKEVNATKHSFKNVGIAHKVDQVLVVDLHAIGTMRDFANYVPVGDPYAIFRGLMYTVDIPTNTYVFYEPINIKKYSETPWKEDGYPGITNAYYTALEQGKAAILDLNTVAPLTSAASGKKAAGDKEQEGLDTAKK